MASFKKIDNNNWEVRFYISDYKGAKKQIKKRGFKTKSEANQFSIDYINLYEGKDNIYFTTLVDEFYKFKKDTLKYNTLKNFTYRIDRIKIYFEKLKINDITPLIIYDFLDTFKNTPTIYKLILNDIKGVYKFGNQYYNVNDISKNIIMNIKKREKKDINIITIEDYHYINNLIKNDDYNFYILFNLLYFSGLRIGEATALTIKDIDFNKNTITVNRTKLNKNKTNSPKTRSSYRTISMPKSYIIILKEYIELFMYGIEDNDFIFFNTQQYYRRKLAFLIKKYNLKSFKLHDLRHSHVSMLIFKGYDIVSISKRLGHSNPTITLGVYSHLYNKIDTIGQELEEFF